MIEHWIRTGKALAVGVIASLLFALGDAALVLHVNSHAELTDVVSVFAIDLLFFLLTYLLCSLLLRGWASLAGIARRAENGATAFRGTGNVDGLAYDIAVACFVGLATAAATLVFLDSAKYPLRKMVTGTTWPESFALVVPWAVLGSAVVASILCKVLRRRLKHARGPFLGSMLVAGALVIVVGTLAFGRNLGGGQAARREQGVDGPGRQVILITIDSLRADALGVYNSAMRTPNIDALAADGALFENAFAAAPWTVPSVTTIMTGLSPSVHEPREYSEGYKYNGTTTLAEQLALAGHETAAIVANPALQISGIAARGFHEYVHYPRRVFMNSIGGRLFEFLFPSRFTAKTSDLGRLAGEWVRTHRDRPFFLWIHYLDPHWPYRPPSRFVDRRRKPPGFPWEGAVWTAPTKEQAEWFRATYQGEVGYVDESIGKFIATLKKLGVYERSLIVLTADHGEEFWEHHGILHGHTLYNELLKVPLLITAPGVPRGKRVEQYVSLEALAPTVLDLLGNENAKAFLSESFRGSIDGAGYIEKPLIGTGILQNERRESVLFNGYKYIVSTITGREELYDLRRDPLEQENISRARPEMVEHARMLLARHREAAAEMRQRFGSAQADPTPAPDADTVQKLRSLGYL